MCLIFLLKKKFLQAIFIHLGKCYEKVDDLNELDIHLHCISKQIDKNKFKSLRSKDPVDIF